MLRRWTGRSRRLLRSRWTRTAAGLTTVVLGVVLWWLPPAPRGTPPSSPALSLVDGGDLVPTGIAYPLPERPFSNQARPPCRSRRGEVELNGGCWVELVKRSPCEDTAEYKGKCYLPVGERSARPPQSVQ